jgi:hypothetical protein
MMFAVPSECSGSICGSLRFSSSSVHSLDRYSHAEKPPGFRRRTLFPLFSAFSHEMHESSLSFVKS